MAVAKLREPSRITEAVGRLMEVRAAPKPSPKKSPPRFEEYAMVRALVDIREGSEVVPAGSVGTVVDIIRGGVGYEVEFMEPKHVVISARPSELALA